MTRAVEFRRPTADEFPPAPGPPYNKVRLRAQIATASLCAVVATAVFTLLARSLFGRPMTHELAEGRWFLLPSLMFFGPLGYDLGRRHASTPAQVASLARLYAILIAAALALLGLLRALRVA